MKKYLALLAVCFLVLCFGIAAEAQDKYPSRPIKFVIPLGPGTVNDVVARTISEPLAQELKTEILIEYRPGAGGAVGSDFVAKSKPDGYTLGSINSSALTNAPAISANLPYDPLKDFTPLADVGGNPVMLVVNAGSAWKTLDDFVGHANKNPSKLSCGTSGVGTAGHFNLELIKVGAGVQITHVPYKAGSGPAIAALLGNHIDCIMQIWSTVGGHVRAGKFRVLAVTAPVKETPEVPTFTNKGLSQVSLGVTFGFYGPANLPRDVVARLVPAFERAIMNPATVAKLEKAGLEVAYTGPKELFERIKKELAISREVAKKAGISQD